MELPMNLDSSNEIPQSTKLNAKHYIKVTVAVIIILALSAALVIPLILMKKYEPTPPIPPTPEDPDNDNITNAYNINLATLEYTGLTAKMNVVNYRPPNTKLKAKEIPVLTLIGDSLDDHLLRISVRDNASQRWEPNVLANNQMYDSWIEGFQHYPIVTQGWNMQHEDNKTFFMQMLLKGVPIIDTFGRNFRFYDNFIEFEFTIQNHTILGIGERQASSLIISDGTYTIFNRGQNLMDDGKRPGKNMYGSHPFILTQANDGRYVAFFMKNSNAMDIVVNSSYIPGAKNTSITFKMSGGIIDLYIFHDANAEYLLKKYHNFIGLPSLPPFYALGFQYGERNVGGLEKLKNKLSTLDNANIPYDVIWTDRDFADNYMAFTVSDKFKGINQFVQSLPNKKLATVIDTPIVMKDGYFLYDQAKNSLISSSIGNPFIGKVNSLKSVYLNVISPSAQQIIKNALSQLATSALVSGFALDLDEPYNECDGECENPSNPDYNNMIYTPGQANLSTNTLSMDCYYNTITDVEFNYHNIYSTLYSNLVFNSLTSSNKRPFIISRSSFPSTGRYAGHWTGDNKPTWENLRSSLRSLVNFNLFGIPYTGENICGITGPTDPELCSRWIQLGSFYPLSRVIAEELITPFTSDPKILSALTSGMQQRYSLLRFYYTKLYQSSLWGGPLITPLSFEFNDYNLTAPEVIDNSFMIGHSILAVFSLKQGLQSGQFYFPNWRWYNLHTLEIDIDYDPTTTKGSNVTLNYPFDNANTFIKGGSIIPYQPVTLTSIKSSADLAKVPMTYLIAVDSYGKAEGQMIVDDGETLYSNYRHYSFAFINKIFKINRVNGFDYKETFQIDIFRKLMILGQPIDHELTFACIFDINLNVRNLKFEYDPDKDIITLTDPSAEKDLYALYNIESIIFGGVSDQDVCKSKIYMGKNSYSSDKKTFTAKLNEKIPGQVMLHSYSFDAILKSDKLLQVKIEKDTAIDAFEVPYALNDSYVNKSTINLDQYIFSINNTVGSPFNFKVCDRKDPTSAIFSTYDNPFYYSDNFLYLKAKIKGVRIFGLGERVKLFEINDGIYTIMSRDAVSPIETDEIPGNNMYGHHPVYFVQSDNPSEWFAVLMLNPSPMDVRITRKLNVISIEHIMSAGLMDIYIMQKGSIDEIIHEYHMLIGRPVLVPQWTFGNHQCRWGYKGEKVLRLVVTNFMSNQIPLDVMWTDIDYMKDYQDFSLNLEQYPTMMEFTDYLHSIHKKLVPINDAGIARTDGYFAYDKGKELGVFIRSEFDFNKNLQGIVWPGYAVYTDFYHPQAFDYWKENMKVAKTKFHFDGMWIDMNEASNFCDGECPDEYDYIKNTFPNSQHNTIIYIPGHNFLNKKTISMEGRHANEEREILLHSSYGHMMGIATSKYFSEVENTRPFVLTRSSYVGSGKYMSHWLGDNFKDYRFLRYSISGIYDAQLFGLTLVGADVCGFTGTAPNYDLCKRWIQIGAFYPFCRNHNDLSGKPQEPYVDENLKSVYIKALHVRYSLIKYIYTLYVNVASNGGIFFRPLIFDYPNDANTYKNYEDTFMLGGIKVSPIMDENKTEALSYFPNDDWYEFFTGKYQYPYSPSSSVGKYNKVTSEINSGDINIHIRGGAIIPIQQVSNNVLTTYDLKSIKTDLKVTISTIPGKLSTGQVYYDDGESLDSLTDNSKHCLMAFTFTPSTNKLTISKEGTYLTGDDEMNIGKISFLHTGALKAVKCGRLYSVDGKDTNKTFAGVSESDNVLSLTVNSNIFNYGSIVLNDRC